jgi:hypothetical protein
MKKSMVLFLVIFFVLFSTIGVYAAWEISKVSLDFGSRIATVTLISGNMVSVNSTIQNGDTIQTNTFVPDGRSSQDEQMTDPSFSAFISSVIKTGFPFANSLVNAVTSGTVNNVTVTGQDTTTVDLNAS